MTIFAAISVDSNLFPQHVENNADDYVRSIARRKHRKQRAFLRSDSINLVRDDLCRLDPIHTTISLDESGDASNE